MEISLNNRTFKKLARTCGMFFKIRHILLNNVSICLFNSLLSPFLQYGMLVWGLTCESIGLYILDCM